MLLENISQGVESLKLQLEIFPLETNKQTNKQKIIQIQKDDTRLWTIFYLFSKWACVNAIYFVYASCTVWNTTRLK